MTFTFTKKQFNTVASIIAMKGVPPKMVGFSTKKVCLLFYGKNEPYWRVSIGGTISHV